MLFGVIIALVAIQFSWGQVFVTNWIKPFGQIFISLLKLTAILASIVSAATPSAGIIILVIVLEYVGFPSEKLAVALAMIMSVDRPLDMAQTVVNISEISVFVF